MLILLTSDVGRRMLRLQLDPAICSKLDMATLARRLHSCTSLQHLDLGGAGEGTPIMQSYCHMRGINVMREERFRDYCM